ncbi:LytTR family transcriptional regulator DNA-binding domain-containing protein [Clostridium sp. 19966]|uniref:LytTR family DNA-binding domain-containing protein n=1 Tax=Clostridium sp. 19966 TaxID=2768166 RepID=UPI0028DE3DAB|nr:LytTR family DNA-binding domain-containing protein [Clostridium sp. 19966]MDT8718011.1 LytTR family transcriptional regulator DNA-binding domain-containing protein [Clostridium sp. 19966]
MKLILDQNPEYNEPEIRLCYNVMDERLVALVRQIQLYLFSITVTRDRKQYSIPLESVYYFESVDDKTFVYCKNEVYECSLRLYELEQQMEGSSCVRISKACILNTLHVESVRPLFGAKLEALLENREKVIINRHYVPTLKAKLGIGEGSK